MPFNQLKRLDTARWPPGYPHTPSLAPQALATRPKAASSPPPAPTPPPAHTMSPVYSYNTNLALFVFATVMWSMSQVAKAKDEEPEV
ncbi:uncharacterized protein CcaverHIS019_0608350 [Cutaneotrichosporon cavernicola]|uniref:Uncharacterized protein n=1 Tax=Cutaneotrichosporon cavernicola TaxID=279322 RepID=A0AA48L9L1_9TREE|nr:uncharacterized protein CcaverHIS019_0608350 [Cutaneotrichosporon cavernicola]BEI94376.1 hypothetical protein CcaverHIS019_0608350 [Cutaneotrichosporon cavernicola]BEJ09914.1 hypothetical protein CcaverHIS641_0608290 [Cutaneotrichosporon cavernicola]